MARSHLSLVAWLLLGTPALAQEGASMMVPTVPGMFGIDTCGAFLCGTPATVPSGSKRSVHALEAAFRPRPGSLKRDTLKVPMDPQVAPASSNTKPAAVRTRPGTSVDQVGNP